MCTAWKNFGADAGAAAGKGKINRADAGVATGDGKISRTDSGVAAGNIRISRADAGAAAEKIKRMWRQKELISMRERMRCG